MDSVHPSWLRQWWQESASLIWPDTLQIEDAVLQQSFPLTQLWWRPAFTETRLTVDLLRLMEDQLIIEATFHGRHSARFAGIPPTHRLIAVPLQVTCVIRQLVVSQITLAYDPHHVLQELGLAP